LESQQKKSDKAERVSVSFTNKFPLTKPYSEKYLKKLIGKTDIEVEDSLKRLDRLTQEEARMAAAQLLAVVNTIENEIGGIADNVLVVDNRVAGIDDRVASVGECVAGVDERVVGVDERVAGVDERVAGVDDRVACVDDRVKDVDDKVKAVDDKLVVVLDGAQYIFGQSSKTVQLLTRPDGKKAKGVIQQTADGVNRMERSWFPGRIHARRASSIVFTGNQLRQEFRRWLSPPDPSMNHSIACNAHHKGTTTWFFEGRMYQEWKSTGSGSLLWIHGKRVPLSSSAAWRHLITSLICSWLREEHTLVGRAFAVIVKMIESLVILQFYDHRRCENNASSLDCIFLLRLPRHQQATLA